MVTLLGERLVPMGIPGGQALGTAQEKHLEGWVTSMQAMPMHPEEPDPGVGDTLTTAVVLWRLQHSRYSCYTDLRCSWGILVGDPYLSMCLFLPFHTFRGNSIFLNASISRLLLPTL